MAYYAIEFQKQLIENSSSKQFSTACLEWNIIDYRILDEDDPPEYCICSHEIKQLITIYNHLNCRELIIGCDCAQRIPSLGKTEIYEKALLNLRDLKNKKTLRLTGPLLQVIRIRNTLPDAQISFLENMKCKKKLTIKQDKYYSDLVEKILKKYPNKIRISGPDRINISQYFEKINQKKLVAFLNPRPQ